MLGFSLDEDAGICFFVEDLNHNGYKTSGDEKDPKNPPPAGTLSYETSSDRSNDRSEEWSNAIDRSSQAALVLAEEIGYDTSSEGQAARPADSSQETENDQGTKVRGQSTTNLPDAENQIGTAEDRTAAIDLGQRGQEEGSNNIAKNKYANS